MFKWVFWWKRSRAWKKFIKTELSTAKMRCNAEPPTTEEVKKFKEEWDLGWDSHMITKVETRKTYYEASLN